MINGIVEIFINDKKLSEESNMIMDNTGELIVDMLTMQRDISKIPTASSILDTSNFSVRAASLGKDALGYSHHAHSDLINVDDGIIRVISYRDFSFSSYQTSAFGLATNTPILPQASHPKMQRLEDKSTAVSGLFDYGHNPNQILSSVKFGCYAPTGTIDLFLVSGSISPGEEQSKVYASATITNNAGLNTWTNPSAIDSRGFIINTTSSMQQGKDLETAEQYRGLLLSYDNNWTNGGLQIRYVLGIEPEDLLVLNAYGGIYNIGLWRIDLKKMLDKGMLPPYDLSASDDMEYKLLARKTFTSDLTYYYDDGAIAGIKAVDTPLKIVWRWVFK